MMDNIYVILFIASTLVGGLSYFVRSMIMQRLDELEKQIITRVTEQEVRQTLDDKITPIKESMIDVKVAVDKVYDLLIRKSHE
jgi:hypothetical protein